MPTKPVGRPTFGDDPLVPLHVSIFAEQKAWLAEQGPNVSATVRNVVQTAMEAHAARKAENREIGAMLADWHERTLQR